MGNEPNARVADDPDWHEAGVVVTRAQPKAEGQLTPLKVLQDKDWLRVSRSDYQRYKEKPSITRYWQINSLVRFEIRNGVLQKVYSHPKINKGKPVEQVVVPECLTPSDGRSWRTIQLRADTLVHANS